MATKRIYFFGEGKADGNAGMKGLLGGKGANLAEMTNLGLQQRLSDGEDALAVESLAFA